MFYIFLILIMIFLILFSTKQEYFSNDQGSIMNIKTKKFLDIYKNGKLYLNKRNYSSNQEWQFKNDMIINDFNNKCLFYNNDNVMLKKCDFKKNNYFNKWKKTKHNQIKPINSEKILGIINCKKNKSCIGLVKDNLDNQWYFKK